ncbi:hypothetical protein CDV55_103987 [Aspergillus turcosus]|uniref:HNH nuclease domain-containing protein n=1 Tax=Aspergillus turcosus TaxID=1245748 RepID=A0A229YV12_9EURO|nr:hypothetical protein CDV55_103987 [Aspergillus turcosus]RLL94815.1 hypothetical protein CFD26_104313 [Aspergillus turcosus]
MVPELKIKWKNAIFPNPDKPTDSIPENLIICLTSSIHKDWEQGYCAFKPLHVSSDGLELECEFHWLPREGHGPTDNVDLSRRPTPTAGLSGSGGRFFHNFDKRIESGYRFVVKMTNPATHPLPSFPLLQMSWKLTQIVALPAAAEDPELEDYDDESETYNKELIDKWMAEESDDDDNEVSFA